MKVPELFGDISRTIAVPDFVDAADDTEWYHFTTQERIADQTAWAALARMCSGDGGPPRVASVR